MSGKSEFHRKIAAAVVAGLAVVSLAFGGVVKHDVLTLDAEELAKLLGTPPLFETISDLQLVVDATFTGVVQKEGRLHSTYDRNQPTGKRACPT